MPYYVHRRDQAPSEGTPYPTKPDAVAARTGDQLITLALTEAERLAWQQREANRTYGFWEGRTHDTFGWLVHEGTWQAPIYRPLPWCGYYTHYAHIATNDPDKIAFTPDDTFGHEDRQLVLTPGRYLERYGEQCGYAKSQWPSLLAQFKILNEPLRITETAEEAARVYCAPSGPGSCMAGEWDISQHPTRVYSAPGDLRVAYLGRLDDDDWSKDTISARAVVWPDKKYYVRVYGDTHTIEQKLLAEGYTRISGWDGARVALIRAGSGGILMPYIDGSCDMATVKSGTILIHDRGERGCQNTAGYLDARSCERCDDGWAESGSNYCESCNSDRWSCDRCGDDYFDNDESYSTTHVILCESCHDATSHTCEACEETFSEYDFDYYDRRTRDRASDGWKLCEDCEHLEQCGDCDTWTEPEDLHTVTVTTRRFSLSRGRERVLTHDETVCGDCRDARAHVAQQARQARRGVVLRRQTASELFVNPSVTLTPESWLVYDAGVDMGAAS